jgi:hypothetical protein
MAKLVEAERGYINVDLVAFMFRKEDGRYVCYSAEGNEVGTLSGRIVEQLLVEQGPARTKQKR